MKLLVIDDEALIRKGIVSLISYEKLGIALIFEADNGQSGLEIVKKEEPDIILCDINMPKINGLDFSKEVKANWPWIKIAIITGYDYFEYAKEAVKIGVEDYVLKPVSKDDVQELIQKLVLKIQEDRKLKEIYKIIQEMDKNSDEAIGYKQQISNILEECLFDIDFSLNNLAERMGLNTSYMSTLFKKLFGIPFSDYLLHQRLEKSKIYLLTTDLKNYEIADKVGIGDPNYFSTLFKKHYGDSPNRYKKKVQKEKRG